MAYSGLLVFAISFGILIHSNCILSLLLQLNRGLQHNGNNLLTSLSGLSLYDCLSECNIRTSCQSIVHRRLMAHCRLYTTSRTETVTRTGSVYAEKSTWTQMSKLKRCDLVCPTSETCVQTGGTFCKHIECQNPPFVDYAIILGNQNSIGAIVKYECLEGADGNNVTSKSTCGSNGQWSEVSLVCEIAGFRRIYIDSFADVGSYVTLLGQEKLNTFHYVSRYACVNLCKLESIYCENVSYFAMNGTCVLSNMLTTISEAPGWEIIEKIFPVTFHVSGSTKSEALEVCSSLNTTIATYTHVLSAYYMGFNRQSCGWTKFLFRVKCFHRTYSNVSSGISLFCSSEQSMGVFCMNPLFIN